MGIRAGFEPATNRFAVCPLEPLEYRIMSMGYKKDIFGSFAYDFELSQTILNFQV